MDRLLRIRGMALVTLLMVPCALAQPITQASFEASSASWSDLSPVARAGFAGLRVRESLGSAGSSVADSGFEIRASQLQLETDLAEYYLDAAPVVYTPLPPTLPAAGSPGVQSNSSHYTDAVVQGTESRAGRFLYILPLDDGEMSIQVPCAEAESSTDNQLTVVSKVDTGRAESYADTSGALQVQACQGSDLSLTGSFRLALWEWDGHLAAAEGETALWSGKTQQENLPGPRLDPTYISRAQQIFLTIRDGSFTIRGNNERPPLLYVNDLQLDGAPNMVLSQASGQVQGIELPVSGGHVEMAGKMSLGLERSSSGIAVQVHDGMENLEVDGQAIELATTTAAPAGGGFPGWGIVGLVGAVLAAPMLFVPRVLQRRREERFAEVEVEEAVDRVEQMMGKMRYAEALPASLHLVNLAPRHPRAQFLRATVLRRLGYTRDALEHHERARHLGLLKDLNPQWTAALDLEAARASLDMARSMPRHRRTDWERKALQHLTQAAATDSAILSDLEVHPELDDLYWRRDLNVAP